MKKRIVIVDDQPEARSASASVIDDALSNLDLESNWEVVSYAPLVEIEDYSALIEEQNISIFLVDERLGEFPDEHGRTADYRGSDLVRFLREHYKDMPIYGITAHPTEPSLEEYFSLFEDVILRETFIEKSEDYVKRFVRAYQSYAEDNEEDLKKLTQLSSKIALGDATAEEKGAAEAIQQKLQIPIVAKTISDRREWLDEFSELISEYENVQIEARRYLDGGSSEK